MNQQYFLRIILLISIFVVGNLSIYASPSILINKNFEGGSLGTIEVLDATTFRCHVEGQYNEYGRNRQASWYYFRMDHVLDCDINVTLTDFVGEYNNTPGACPMNAETIPVFSYDNQSWQHFSAMRWDDKKKEATVTFHPEHDTIWIAHIPPYTPERCKKLLEDTNNSPDAKIEIIGKSVQGRDLYQISVTDPAIPDKTKKVVWLMARQHAWEAATSYVFEGALNWIVSNDPQAVALRKQVIFIFTPTLDPDGGFNGKVRFNANGFDVNRHWDEVKLNSKQDLFNMPEIWYLKKSIAALRGMGLTIDLLLSMHNDENPEYLNWFGEEKSYANLVHKLQYRLESENSFDPSTPPEQSNHSSTIGALYDEMKIPVMLMEQRIGFSKKLKRQPSLEDRLTFGKKLIAIMAETVLEKDQ